MEEDFYDYEEELQPQKKDNLFLWTVLILLLIGAAFACWLGSFYIFGHPEEARCYRVLKKLKKIEAPRRFDVTAAPLGEFISPQRAFERYSTLTRLELERENAELLRIYIKNYTETKKLVPYLRGKFDVMHAGTLKTTDLFTTGAVALMQSVDYPQVVVEHLFPATGANVEAAARLMSPGVVLPIEKTNDVTTIIHVERLADGRMLLTVVPLHYPPYAVKAGAGKFDTEPPADLNVAARLPISRPDQLNEVLKRFAQARASEPAPDPKAEVKPPELVRVDVPLGMQGARPPESGVIPEPKVAPALPVAPAPRSRTPVTEVAMNTRTPPPLPAATPLPVKRASATPAPPPVPPAATPPMAATAPPLAALATPAPAPPALSPTGVPLKRFVESNTGVAPPREMDGAWRLYSPGQQPPGRSVTSSDTLNLIGQAGAGERLYLVGSFGVSARGDNKAVLRPKGEVLPPGSSVRIIVEFPNGSALPDEGEVFARDALHGFEVRSIMRADDGTVNVFVREVTR